MPTSMPPIQVATAEVTVIAPNSAKAPLTVTLMVGLASQERFVMPKP